MQTVQRIVKKTQNGSKMRHLVRKPGLKEALYVEYQTSKHADYTKHCTMMCHMCQFFFFLVCAKHYYLVTRGVDLGQQIMLDVKTDLKWASQSKNYIHIKTHNVRKFLTITRPQDMRPDVFQIFLHTCWEQK